MLIFRGMSILKKVRVTLALSILCFLGTLKFYYLVVYAVLNRIPLENIKIGFIPGLGFRQDPLVFFTSLFYHLGFSHFFSNVIFLLICGAMIELTQGSKKLGLVAVGSGISAKVLLIFLRASDMRPHMGFSGALMGMAVYYLMCANQEGRQRGLRRFDWLVWGAFILFVLPNIAGFYDELKGGYTGVSSLAHLLGGLGGIVIYDLLENGKKNKTQKPDLKVLKGKGHQGQHYRSVHRKAV